jgi:hypothetical protein
VKKYTASARTTEQIHKAFNYHPPKPELGQPERYIEIRRKAFDLALTFAELAPESRELSMALTDLENAVMHVNAAIARNE